MHSVDLYNILYILAILCAYSTKKRCDELFCIKSNVGGGGLEVNIAHSNKKLAYKNVVNQLKLIAL